MLESKAVEAISLLESHPRVGIVGGTNGTGAQFASLLSACGFELSVSGRDTQITNAQLARESDILVLAPPLKSSLRIIADTVSHCERDDQLVIDLCSLKVAQMRAMNQAPGHIVGLHPLFGPHFSDVSGQDMVMCRAPGPRSEAIYEELRELLLALGLVLHEMSAADHDRLMATIQVIPHLSALISGTLFRRLGIDTIESLKICSPVYKTELYMIGRIHSQNPALYASIIAQNPHSEEIVATLSSILGEFGGFIDNGRVDSLETAFAQNQSYFGEFAQTALRESQRLLERAYESK